MEAAYSGQIKTVQILVEIGANVNNLSNYVKTALLRTAENDCLQIVDYLLPLTSDSQQLLLAQKALPEGIILRKKERVKRNSETKKERERYQDYLNCTGLKIVGKWEDSF